LEGDASTLDPAITEADALAVTRAKKIAASTWISQAKDKGGFGAFHTMRPGQFREFYTGCKIKGSFNPGRFSVSFAHRT
jgi:hypothetical protein